ncbi:PucR family transcriptional regulator [Desmospora profundinema]|uniref:Purine catabolism regulator n=1 Tax=Desmospora profundinema TaxID=1571184 RepID=A0ABU1IHZ5_9BACL|nr:PucR family transcriptional regulator ligand-binding domain-containing protein [Desmospora profundinema]MDR6224397.1 purine catabolism regulator [Desmospora profundinema]
MDSNTSLTVHEILERPLFQNARVVAGKKGLNRRVRWVHVLEVLEIDTLIRGEEMIFSTGIVFRSASSSPVSYLQKLIDLRVSCLCVELGHYFESIPKDMIAVADQYDFPIIVFEESVVFADVTQDLHTLIINRHHQILQHLENLSREFHRLTLLPQAIVHILKLLHKNTKSEIVYLPLQGTPQWISSMGNQEQTEWLKWIQQRLENESVSKKEEPLPYRFHYRDRFLLLQPVKAMGQTWAYIGMIGTEQPEEYDYLILDRSSLSIAQVLLRKHYIQERKLHSEHLWVNDLLHHRIGEEAIRSQLGADYEQLKELKSRVCVIEVHNGVDESDPFPDPSVRYDFSLTVRSAFEQVGFRPFITVNNNRIAIIAFDINPHQPAQSRLRRVFKSIQSADIERQSSYPPLRIGMGQSYTGFSGTHLSYWEANQVITVNASCQKQFLFYDDMGVFQLFLHVKEEETLHRFIHRYLGPLVKHDRLKGSQLLHTLKIYLDCDGSKKLAAQKLFIVRQSLYHRLDKIKELLGEDYLSPENRLAIQVALRAYQLLHPEERDG